MRKIFDLRKLSLILIALAFLFSANAQDKPPTEYGSGLKVDLNEGGSKYVRFITWHQFWLTSNSFNSGDDLELSMRLRRSRFLAFAQISDRFLILTHFGLNNLTPSGLDPTGQSSQAQLFMHDAWAEFKINDYLYMGGGLHYWNGISRANNQSTLNMLPLDNPRFAWTTIGTSDQFARHLGFYAKGKVGKLDYRFAWNSPMVNSIDLNSGLGLKEDTATYVGRNVFGNDASNVFAGYVNYQFWDQESNKLPYFVGTYFGKKKVFNLGAGFYSHPNGSVVLEGTDGVGQNVLLWSVDAFMELPFGDDMAFTGYASYQSNDFGENFQLYDKNMADLRSQAVFSGDVIYFQGGVLLPKVTGNLRWQPYVTFTQKNIDIFDDSAMDYGIGINSLITGHHAKITLEYRNTGMIGSDDMNQLLMQAVVFL
jgi:hypothetical protein